MTRVVWFRDGHRPDETLRLGRSGDFYVAEWDGLGRLRARVDGGEIHVEPAADVDPSLERKWRDGPVRALVRHLHGGVTLHASAVALRGVALVFLGDSGAGKSTCAADLCSRLGADLLADDLADFDLAPPHPMVLPTERFHWLLRDSAAALGYAPSAMRKAATDAKRAARSPVPLGLMFALEFSGGELTAVPVRGSDAFACINANYVRFAIDDPSAIARDLHAVAGLVESAPLFRLSRPRAFEALPAVAEWIDAATCRISA